MSGFGLCQGLAVLACAAAVGDGPGTGISRYEYEETHMGSLFKIVLYSPDEGSARRASRAAFDRISALNKAFSDYDPESELMRLCDQAGGPPVAVSDDLYTILQQSRAMFETSSGAFDVTVGPAVRLWRRARRDREMPDEEHLAKARTLMSSRLIDLDPKARTVRLERRGMKLDLGGIAKGFASQAALEVLRSQGMPRSLVAGAGDIVAGDPPPGREGWTVGIAPLADPNAPPRRFLELKNAAISTSGDAERFVVIDGRRYSHIVDPRTGVGVVDRCSVTVVARNGATADALATAIFVLGPAKGLPLAEATPGASALVLREEGGLVRTYETKCFPQESSPPSPRPTGMFFPLKP